MTSMPWLDESPAANGVSVQENFNRWFGASTMVDKDSGTPLTLYHSTFSTFTQPRVVHDDQEYRRFGFHVGTLEAAHARLGLKAREDMANAESSGDAGAQVLPLFVRACNPLRLTENRTGRWGVDDIVRAMMEQAEQGGLPGIPPEVLDAYYEDALHLESVLGLAPPREDLGYDADERLWANHLAFVPGERSRLLSAWIRHLGHDAIVYNNEFETGGDSLILLDANQAKSAIANSGLYGAGASLTDREDALALEQGVRARAQVPRLPIRRIELSASVGALLGMR